MNNASCRSFVLPWKILVILIICLGGLSAHFLAVEIGHFTWEPVVETSSLDGDHGIHQDENSLSINPDSLELFAGIQRLPAEYRIHKILPSLNPQLPPPKFATTA
jgi:hypothetical protein